MLRRCDVDFFYRCAAHSEGRHHEGPSTALASSKQTPGRSDVDKHVVDSTECSTGRSGGDRWIMAGLGRVAACRHDCGVARDRRLSGLVEPHDQRGLGLDDVAAGGGKFGMARIDDDPSTNDVRGADRTADGFDPDGGLIRGLFIGVLVDLLLRSLQEIAGR